MENKVAGAFKVVKREHFLPPDAMSEATWDMPLSIGFGQTNSQPTTVRMMLEWLDVKAGQKILDVGSGSGWTTALLAHLTGSGGKVSAVELVPELVQFGRENCQKLGLQNVSFHKAGKQLGWPEETPYDRILVSAAADELPGELVDQLAPNGRMVVPIKSSVWLIIKDAAGNTTDHEYPGFSFVPLVHA